MYIHYFLYSNNFLVIPPPPIPPPPTDANGYPFSDPNSSANIKFITKSDGTSEIFGVTLLKLIAIITDTGFTGTSLTAFKKRLLFR